MRKLSESRQITLSAMVVALSLLCLYAADIFPVGRIALYVIASGFIYVLACEGAYVSAILTYLATSALAFLILPNRLSVLPYAVLLGHYGIMKTFFSTKVSDRALRVLLNLLYCNMFIAASAAIAYYLLDITLDVSAIGIDLSIYWLIALLQAAFLLYDAVYSLCQRIYATYLRAHVVPRR